MVNTKSLLIVMESWIDLSLIINENVVMGPWKFCSETLKIIIDLN